MVIRHATGVEGAGRWGLIHLLELIRLLPLLGALGLRGAIALLRCAIALLLGRRVTLRGAISLLLRRPVALLRCAVTLLLRAETLRGAIALLGMAALSCWSPVGRVFFEGAV